MGCPKNMLFGPCGGVREDGRCEVAEHACTFLDGTPAWSADAVGGADRRTLAAPPSTPTRSALLQTALTRPVVLTDLTVRPFDPASVRAVTEILGGSCDAVLVGEHSNRPDLPPSLMAAEIRAAGGTPWVTLTCRDRNRVVLETELGGLAAQGAVDGVLCVTGDARAQGVRSGVTQVFDLDGPRLAALAAEAGLPVAVPESPEASPAQHRARRLVVKQQAGASLVVLNHVSRPARVAAFVAEARAAGLGLPVLAGVAVYTDERSARVLQNFPGLHLDPVAVEAVLAAPDPRAAGIAAALQEAEALLAIDGVVGVNLSGLASSAGEIVAAEVKAEIGWALHGR
jgi:5,10-methylenetetrahydrofolate reductase